MGFGYLFFYNVLKRLEVIKWRILVFAGMVIRF